MPDLTFYVLRHPWRGGRKMRFNKILLNNYIETKEGKTAYDLFKNLNTHIREADNQLFQYINAQYLDPIEKEYFDAELKDVNLWIDETQKWMNESKGKIAFNTIDSLMQNYEDIIKSYLDNNKDIQIRDIMTLVRFHSLAYSYFYPEYCFPYFFDNHFYKLERIFSEFNIPLPEPPSKRKYYERTLYYTELCKVLYDFRMQIELSPIELNVFLYSFAPKLIEDFDLNIDLPQPTKVYICGGSKVDSEWMKATKEDCTACWAGNINTLPGDVVIIYEVAPTSSIKTVWRALSPGFYDPFSYYAIRQWVGNHIKVPAISYDELCENPVWREKGIVKSHMQGIAGTPCTKEEYEEIKKMLKSKGFNVSLLPQLISVGLESQVDPADEKEVEEELLEPLLKKLGFTEKDWKRQISVRMGRGQYVYPDYVIFPKTKKGEESGNFIWEAKFSIPHKNQLKYDFCQAKSYAMRLGTDGLGLVSREGVWLSFQKDGYMFEKIITYSWADINNSDIFNDLLIKIGRR